MKICVYFTPNIKNDNFEGTRLRKSLKGALQINDVTCCRNIVDTYDLIHFLSLNDELKINDAIEAKIPVVFSALSCEMDTEARILVKKGNELILPKKARDILNKVDVVIVSDETSKKYLIDNGVTSNIEVISPGVNPSRFEISDALESDIFYNYYQLERDSKFIVSIGQYNDKKKIKALSKIASSCPDLKFFYFGKKNIRALARLNTSLPKNVKLCTLANNEIYCSMLKNASIMLALDNSRHNPLTLLDAMASKTQIVALEPLYLNEEILKDAHAYIAKDEIEASEIIQKLINGKLKYHTEEAYKYACDNNLENTGKKLKTLYQKLLDGRKVK